VFVVAMLLCLIFCAGAVSAMREEELAAVVNRDLDGYREWLVDGANQRIRESCLRCSSEIETVEKRVLGEAQARASRSAQEAVGRVAVFERGASEVRTQCVLRAKFLNDDLKKRAGVLKQRAEGFQERSVMMKNLEREFFERVSGHVDSNSAGADLSEFIRDCRKCKMKSKTGQQILSLLKGKSDYLTLRIILKSLMRRGGERKEEAVKSVGSVSVRQGEAQEKVEKMPTDAGAREGQSAARSCSRSEE
jgi:hypothetical protein